MKKSCHVFAWIAFAVALAMFFCAAFSFSLKQTMTAPARIVPYVRSFAHFAKTSCAAF